jgi:hypothetical protein
MSIKIAVILFIKPFTAARLMSAPYGYKLASPRMWLTSTRHTRRDRFLQSQAKDSAFL